jgi:hypothetical protein
MNKDLGIRAAVRAAIAAGSDHWTVWLDNAGLRFPQWYRSPQAGLVPPMSADQRDLVRMTYSLRADRADILRRWV